MDKSTRVLFVCTGNSARSQMAEGLLRSLGGEGFEVFSAGTAPKGVHPLAVQAMAELDINIDEQRSKSLTEYLNTQFDYVITVCDRAREQCPIFPGGGVQLHWSFDDPAATVGDVELQCAVFRSVRDEIATQIARFLKDL